MTELERRALLGDAEAQRECTKKMIVLECPICKGKAKIKIKPEYGWKQYDIHCEGCGLTFNESFYTQKEALSEWNTRPAPPIGRCGECKHQGGNVSGNPNVLCINMKPDDFCSYFEPRYPDAT